LVAALAALSACSPDVGGPSPTSTSTTLGVGSTTTTLRSREAADAFRDCLAAADVLIDEVPLDGNGRPRLNLAMDGLDFSDPGVAQAVSSCSATLATGALDMTVDDLIARTVVGQLEAFTQCIRDRGIEFPDPIAGFMGVGSPYPVAEIPYSDAGLAEAIAACESVVLVELPGLPDGS
jgi:hypothetical protein